MRFINVALILLSACFRLSGADNGFMPLGGWQYAWGGDAAPAGQAWSDTASPMLTSREFKDGILWFRVKLPPAELSDPVIFFEVVDIAFEAWLDDRPLYANGSLDDKLGGFAWHFIPLPRDFPGRTLILRIRSSIDSIGFYQDSSLIGERSAIIRRILAENLDELFFGLFFILAGAGVLALYLIKFRELSFIACALFFINMGVYTLTRTDVKQLITGQNHLVWGSLELVSLYFAPALFLLILKGTLKPSRRNPFHWLWAVHLAFAAGMSLAAFVHPNTLMDVLAAFKAVLLADEIAILLYLAYAIRRGKRDAVIIMAGMIMFVCFGTFDILQGMRILPMLAYVSHWGLLLLIGCLSSIIYFHVVLTYRNLARSYRDLARKNNLLDKTHQELEELYREIEFTQKEVIYRLSEVAEARSKETGNHVRRVAKYCELIAERCGLDGKAVQVLKLAAPMHDVGKLGIPDSILNKPDKLTTEEFNVIRTHTVIGYEMLNKSPRDIFQAASIVSYEHHERFDGHGYPRRLHGQEIHLYGRITAIADVFDSLASTRCYKKAWDLDRVIEWISKESGRQFDPELVDIFLGVSGKFVEVRDAYRDEQPAAV